MMKQLFTTLTLVAALAIGTAEQSDASAITWFEELPVEIHGFFSQGYLDSNGNNYFADTEGGTGDFREIGLNVSKSFTPNFRVGAQVFARDLADIGNNEVVLDWAVADYRIHDAIGIRLGKVKMPLGFYNQTRDVDALRTQILLPQSVYPESLRDTLSALVGGGLYGNIDTGLAGTLSYELQAGRFDVPDESGVAKLIEAGGNFVTTGYDEGDSYVAAIHWAPPLEGVRVGWAYFDGELLVETETLEGNRYGLPAGLASEVDGKSLVGRWYSAEYQADKFSLYAEFTSQDRDSQVPGQPLGQTRLEGWYLGGEYQLLEKLVGAVTYSEYYNNRNDKDGNRYADSETPAHRAWQKEWVLSLKYEATKHLIFKIEEHIIDGTASLFSDDNDTATDRYWDMLAVKATVIF